jgi:acyl-CoA synthetase (AMP-forming)/AMP-acid ligase II
LNYSASLLTRIRQRCSDERHSFVDLSAQAGAVETESAQLMELADKIAAYLSANLQGHVVVLCLDQFSTFLPVFWACLSAGLTAVPVSVATSPDRPSQSDLRQLELLLAQCGPVAVVVDENTACLRAQLDSNSSVLWLPFSRLITSHAAASLPAQAPSEISFVLLTSGTTGSYKYAAFSGTWFDYEVSNSRRVLSLFPLGSSTGIGSGYALNRLSAYLPLCEAVRDPGLLLACIEQYRIEVVVIPPVMVTMLVHYFTAATTPLVRRDLASLVKLNIGSSTIPLAAVEQLQDHLQRWGAAEGVIHFAYGLTETGGVSYGPYRGADCHSHPQGLRIGPLSPGLEVQISAPEPGSAGPIAVRRPFTFLGYLQPQDGVDWRLVPFQSGKDWFHTGDIGLLDGDGLVLSGREKDTIMLNSRKIALSAIERLVEDRWPDLFDVVVAVAGPQEKLLVFVVLATEAVGLPLDELQPQLAEAIQHQFGLPLAQLVPLKLTEIPRTSTGKVHKGLLLEAWAAQPSPATETDSLEPLPQTTPIAQLLLAEIRQHASLFKVADPRLPLSAFGIDSLALAQIIGTVERASGLPCRLGACPPDPSINELAALFRHSGPLPAASRVANDHSHSLLQLSADLSRYPQRGALAHQIQAANLQVGGEPLWPDLVVRRFNGTATGVPLVLLGNMSSSLVQQIAREMADHPVYYMRVLHGYASTVNHTYLVCCYLDWLEACLPDCHPVVVGFCVSGILALDLARQLWRRRHAPRLTVLMDWNVGRVLSSDPYQGTTAYHIHEFFHGGLPERQQEIQASLLQSTPNTLLTYWAANRDQGPEPYIDHDATLEILLKILRHDMVKPILMAGV